MEERLVALLLALIALLAIVAKATRVPYPIVFVLAGAALAFVPGIPPVRLRPELVFLIFLPPLLFGDAWTTDLRLFVRYLEPIALLATGPVLVTTFLVAWVAHAALGLPFAVGATLGAILAPTDAVATDAIAEEVGLPQRLLAILAGESLVNDATGLVVYKFAVAAVVTGTFSFADAGLQFVWGVAGGVGLGIGIALLIARLMLALRGLRLTDELIAVVLSVVTPYAIYIPADALGVSGVLAAVAGGMVLSRKTQQIFDADDRITAAGVWNLMTFLFNGALFILLGLQLRGLVGSLAAQSPQRLAVDALLATLTVVAARFLWLFPVVAIRWRFPHVRRREGAPPPPGATLVLAWTGMRGVVSLAAALALPERVADGGAFPARDLLVFVTFCVIVATLLGEGLTLPALIRRLRLVDTERDGSATSRARVLLADAGLRRLVALESGFASPAEWEIAGRLRGELDAERTHYQRHVDGTADESAESDARQHAIENRLRDEIVGEQRRRLDDLRRTGGLDDELYRNLQWEIDLADSRRRNAER